MSIPQSSEKRRVLPEEDRVLCASRSALHRQRGAVLAVGLILLFLIILFALAAVRGIVAQERIAGNLQDREIAFQNAEIALSAAEKVIVAKHKNENSLTFDKFDPANPAVRLADWQTSNYRSLCISHKTKLTWLNSSNDCSVATTDSYPPGYRIEDMSAIAGAEGVCRDSLYRIRALGRGRNDDTVVVLESYFCGPAA
ncbi:MAG: hypothetical protein LBG69_00285 [Zoogloeaceae bacterium]|jgi:type IV pilus assembly protein PilX|nr:hypothetical protein [Zoogloeaceae bacterium]